MMIFIIKLMCRDNSSNYDLDVYTVINDASWPLLFKQVLDKMKIEENYDKDNDEIDDDILYVSYVIGSVAFDLYNKEFNKRLIIKFGENVYKAFMGYSILLMLNI